MKIFMPFDADMTGAKEVYAGQKKHICYFGKIHIFVTDN
jgi:hypothetical protein